MNLPRQIFCAACTLLLVSCSAASSIKKAQLPMPEHFRNLEHGNSNELQKYWENLGDPQLNDLVTSALNNNADFKAAALRLRRDYASARIKFADLLPNASAEGDVTRTELSLNTGQPITALGIPRQTTLYTAAFDFTYEIDLWGHVRNQFKAAHAAAKKSYFQYLSAKQILIAQTVKTATLVRAKRLQASTLHASWQARHEQALIAKQRYASGLLSLSDYLRVAARSIDAQSLWQNARVQELSAATSLAILLNENPTIFRDDLKPQDLSSTPQLLPDTIPSVWIRSRTDVLSAEQDVIASNALSQSALAEFFPKFTFDARLGVQSQNTGNLFSQASRFFSFGPQVSLPIFNAGQTIANYQANRFEAKAGLQDYKSTVLKAFKDAEDKLAGYNAAVSDANLYREVYDAAEKVYSLTLLKSKVGLLGKYDTSDVEVERNQALNLFSDKEYELIAQWADLMTAFGGGITIKR
jgi:NodT family efflux transporter outer membrane factor (OMF) lipoprotein